MKYWITLSFLLFTITNTTAQRSLAVRVVADAALFSELDDAVPTFGVGAEARLGKKWSIAGDFAWGSFDNVDVFSFRPDLRFYFSETFKGLYLKGGTGFYTFKTDENAFLPFPFDSRDGNETNFLTINAGLGLSTIVLERWNIGAHLTIGGTFNTSLEEYLNVGFNIGYLF